MVKHLPTVWETQVRSLVRKILWRRKWKPTPILLPGKSHGWRSLVGYSPWGHKESDTTERLHFHFYPVLQSHTPHICIPEDILFSLCAVPSLVLSLANLSYFIIPNSSSHLNSESPPCSAAETWKLKSVSWDNCGGYIVCCPSLRVTIHCNLIPVSW